MSWEELLTGFAIAVILEGLHPLISPNSWRESVISILHKSDKFLFTLGLLSVISGCIMLYLVRG
ncbi:MAG TPA: DUF2065 domain-containing protein [Candidatus Atribacteria bacterium]|nr:DUF2065 domain-containing protein [Candidatus Atribacteria bacterium]